jgi:hypothetical protein
MIFWALVLILVLIGVGAYVLIAFQGWMIVAWWPLVVIFMGITLGLRPILRKIGLGYVGDAARYLSPAPANVAVRQAIRSAAIDLLEGLHDDPTWRRYHRVILVGHSLGSVIGYASRRLRNRRRETTMQIDTCAANHLLVRTTVILTIAVGVVLAMAAPSSAQSCTSSPTSAPLQGGYRYISFQAHTTQHESCSDRTTKVSGWIQGVPSECLEPFDSFDSQGNCFDEDTETNAGVIVGGHACREWSGKSDHKYVQGGTTTNVQLGRTTPLNGGPCAGEDPAFDCALLGQEYYWDGFQCVYAPGSPIIISLEEQNDYKLTSAEDGVLFDIDANGTVDQVAWTPAGSGIAFLAIDRNGDGRINDGSELFGNHTLAGMRNGFEALRAMNMASNGGVAKASVSQEDPLFGQLLLWTDQNHNGVSETSELRPANAVLSEVGIGYQVFNRVDKHGNAFRYRGWVHVRTAPGRNEAKSANENKERTRHVWDVYFKISN